MRCAVALAEFVTARLRDEQQVTVARHRRASLVAALRRVRRQHNPNRGAAVLAGADRHAAVEALSALLDRLEATAPPLAGAVVGDLGRNLALDLFDPNRDPGRRSAPDRLRDGLTDYLVERDLRLLGELRAAVEVEVELHLVREPDLIRERPHRRSEPLVAEHDRLDVERQVAQRADRLAVALQRRG